MEKSQEKSSPYATIGVAGGGAWGTALGGVAAQSGRRVVLWARESDVVDSINAIHENARFLPGVSLDPAIRATKALADLLSAEALLITTPAQHIRSTLQA